jgi:hypothetical protein
VNDAVARWAEFAAAAGIEPRVSTAIARNHRLKLPAR